MNLFTLISDAVNNISIFLDSSNILPLNVIT